MKYLISWVARPGVTEESAARSLQVFSKWGPAQDVTFEQFLGRIDGQGGYAVVTSDNATSIAKDMAIFSAWFEMSVIPVIEIAESAAAGSEAVEFRESIS